MHLKGYDPCTRFDFGVLISTPSLPGLCMTPASKSGKAVPAVAYEWLEEAM